MKRFIAQFAKGGAPDLYAVVDTIEGYVITEPREYHLAIAEARARNNGTYIPDLSGLADWLNPAPSPPTA